MLTDDVHPVARSLGAAARVAPGCIERDSVPAVSIIVPTLNEAENLPALAARIDAAMAGYDYELLIIDDASTDDTPTVCADLSRGFPLRLVARETREGGLSGAVLVGMSIARGEQIVVMDGDLQHPPEVIPQLLAALDAGADFSLGSRYMAGGSTNEKFTLYRRLNSRIATWLARPFAGKTRDPMSGFFALHRSTLQHGSDLTPLGYKIALELICKCRVERLREVPIHFGSRDHGRSKLTVAQQFKYLEHLSRLYDYAFPRMSPMAKFLIATGTGWCMALAALGLCNTGHAQPMLAMAIACIASILTTLVFHQRYVRTQRNFLPTRHPWRDFWTIALVESIACLATAAWGLHRIANPRPLEIFVMGFAVATAVRYVLRKELVQDIRGGGRVESRTSAGRGADGEARVGELQRAA